MSELVNQGIPPQLQLITSANCAAYLIAFAFDSSVAKVEASSSVIFTGSILQEYAAPAMPTPLFAMAPAIPAHDVPCAAALVKVPGLGLLSHGANPALKSQPR